MKTLRRLHFAFKAARLAWRGDYVAGIKLFYAANGGIVDEDRGNVSARYAVLMVGKGSE